MNEARVNGRQGRYIAQFTIAIVIHVIVLFGTMILMTYMIGWFGYESPLRLAAVALPVIPLVFALRAFVGGLREMDELQRRIQLEAIAISLAGVCIAGIISTMLELVGVRRMIGLFYPVAAAAFWGIGLWAAGRRYR